MVDPELKQQLDQLTKDVDEIKKNLHGINKAMRWGAILGWLRIAVFIIPIVIAYFYLLPLIEPMIRTYSELFNPEGSSGNSNVTDIDSLKNLLDQYKQ